MDQEENHKPSPRDHGYSPNCPPSAGYSALDLVRGGHGFLAVCSLELLVSALSLLDNFKPAGTVLAHQSPTDGKRLLTKQLVCEYSEDNETQRKRGRGHL